MLSTEAVLPLTSIFLLTYLSTHSEEKALQLKQTIDSIPTIIKMQKFEELHAAFLAKRTEVQVQIQAFIDGGCKHPHSHNTFRYAY